MKPRIVISRLQNIFKNLSAEELFSEEAKAPVLFLYRNQKTIVIGRNQNPWKEIHIDRMESDQVTLCRRKSGGGAVYQDLGNTCFSFINPNSPQDFKSINNSIVLRALTALDIEAETSGRNDIVVEGKKVSGSAYKIQSVGSHLHTIHHGTMLINTDTQALIRYLNPSKAKLESKGIKSVASRVSNLVDFNSQVKHEDFVKSMAKSFTKDYPDAEIVHLEGVPPIVTLKANELAKWEWVYGESPQFSHHLETRFKWGIIDMHLEVQEALVVKCKIFSDCLFPEFIEFLETQVIGKKYGNEIAEVLNQNVKKEFQNICQEFVEWFLTAV